MHLWSRSTDTLSKVDMWHWGGSLWGEQSVRHTFQISSAEALTQLISQLSTILMMKFRKNNIRDQQPLTNKAGLSVSLRRDFLDSLSEHFFWIVEECSKNQRMFSAFHIFYSSLGSMRAVMNIHRYVLSLRSHDNVVGSLFSILKRGKTLLIPSLLTIRSC